MDTTALKRSRHLPASAPLTIADMAPEILLRLPPDDPAYLVRAALVCKPWRRLLTGQAFLGRYRAFHRTPPMLGFVLNLKEHFNGMARFFPTSSFRPAAPDYAGMDVLDARHGRVLLQTTRASASSSGTLSRTESGRSPTCRSTRSASTRRWSAPLPAATTSTAMAAPSVSPSWALTAAVWRSPAPSPPRPVRGASESRLRSRRSSTRGLASLWGTQSTSPAILTSTSRSWGTTSSRRNSRSCCGQTAIAMRTPMSSSNISLLLLGCCEDNAISILLSLGLFK